ncbi:MAG: S-layer homology domain-containing protein [Patescibacteria group bacterium]
MRRFSAACTLLSLLIPYGASAAPLNPEDLEFFHSYVLELLNDSRAEEGLPALKHHFGLEQVAQNHSDDSATHFNPLDTESREQSYLAHVSSDGRTLNARLRDGGVDPGTAFAENAGYWIRSPYGEPREAGTFGIRMMHQGMMAEVPPNDGHREAILGDYTHVGVGLSLMAPEGSDLNAMFLVTDFVKYGSLPPSSVKEGTSLSSAHSAARSFPRHEIPTHGGPFLDVRPTDKYAVAIAVVKEHGIIRGYEDGTFRSDQTVTRAELLKMLMDEEGVSPIGREFSACFKDVFNQWFAPYACVAKREGWIKGYEDGTFQPGKPVTRAEAVTMAARILGIPLDRTSLIPFDDAPEESWFYLPLQILASNRILPFSPRSFRPHIGMRRGEVAEMVYLAMERPK